MHAPLLALVLTFSSCKQAVPAAEEPVRQVRRNRKPLPTSISVHGRIKSIDFQDLSKSSNRSNYYTYITLYGASTTPAVYGQLLVDDHIYLRPTVNGVDRSFGAGDAVELTVSTALREGRNIIYDLKPG